MLADGTGKRKKRLELRGSCRPVVWHVGGCHAVLPQPAAQVYKPAPVACCTSLCPVLQACGAILGVIGVALVVGRSTGWADSNARQGVSSWPFPPQFGPRGALLMAGMVKGPGDEEQGQLQPLRSTAKSGSSSSSE